jgi:hypothetical protein
MQGHINYITPGLKLISRSSISKRGFSRVGLWRAKLDNIICPFILASCSLPFWLKFSAHPVNVLPNAIDAHQMRIWCASGAQLVGRLSSSAWHFEMMWYDLLLRRLGPPQTSQWLPEQGIAQSVEAAGTDPAFKPNNSEKECKYTSRADTY